MYERRVCITSEQSLTDRRGDILEGSICLGPEADNIVMTLRVIHNSVQSTTRTLTPDAATHCHG